MSTVTSEWMTHDLKQKSLPNDKNFKVLNKLATKNRVTTAAAQNRFRQKVDVRLKDPLPLIKYAQEHRRVGLHYRTSSQQQEDVQYVYGMPNRPSTPIRTVVNGVYGIVAEYEQSNRQTEI